MFGGNGGPSLADIAAVTGNNNGDGFGGGNGWWVLIILFAIFGGWGRGGNGAQDGGSGSGSFQGALTRGDLCMDMNFQELQNGVRNISDTVNLGFANLNSTICAQQYNTANLLNQMNITNLQNMNALQSIINQCCCDEKSLFAQAEYNRATDTCSITRAIQDAARDIIQNDNANYRSLHDEQIAIQMQQKDARIQELTGMLNNCNATNLVNNAVQSVVNQVNPNATPVYVVGGQPRYPYNIYQYPYGYYGNGVCGCNNGSNYNFQ